MIYPNVLTNLWRAAKRLITVQRGEISPARYQLPRNYVSWQLSFVFSSAPTSGIRFSRSFFCFRAHLLGFTSRPEFLFHFRETYSLPPFFSNKFFNPCKSRELNSRGVAYTIFRIENIARFEIFTCCTFISGRPVTC